jgi:hypothetical protein
MERRKVENFDQIELHFENQNTNETKSNNEKPYRVIRVKLNDNIKLNKYILKKVMVKKSQFEMYPTLDKFLK